MPSGTPSAALPIASPRCARTGASLTVPTMDSSRRACLLKAHDGKRGYRPRSVIGNRYHTAAAAAEEAIVRVSIAVEAGGLARRSEPAPHLGSAGLDLQHLGWWN